MTGFLQFDSLALISIAAYVALWLIAVAAAPKRDLQRGGISSALLILAGTVLAYAAGSVWVFAAGWVLTQLPTLRKQSNLRAIPKFTLVAGAFALVVGAALATSTDETYAWVAFLAFVIAALLRKGMFPAHFWVVSAFETGSLFELGLLMNSHLGAYLMVRFAVPLLPANALEALPLASVLTLFTSVYAAVRALAEGKPRRVLALLCVSQASFILAGLENRNVEGITGALVQLWVVAFATTGLLGVYSALEARSDEVESPKGFLGYGSVTPRLAVFFAVCGLALVGLPGTLGFASEDLLFHGALEAHPFLGIALPLATALNAITVLRLFATLFLGRRAAECPQVPDARPRERWALAAPVVFLVAGGIFPGVFFALRSPAAERLVELLSGAL